MLQLAKRFAASHSTILITGESGTGKELLAQGIHNESPRRHGPFVAINCAAFPESLLESELFGHEKGAFTGAITSRAGRFELANGGTLFLDEIGDMPLGLQTRLLRVLAEGEVAPLGAARRQAVDIQVICATHRDLAALVAAGGFREDLYYRLNGMVVSLPPLRERSDREELLDYLLAEEARGQRIQLDGEVRQGLLAYRWPGNVRQLENVIRRSLVLHGEGGALLD